MAERGAMLGFSSPKKPQRGVLLGDGSYVENRPSRWELVKRALWDSNLNTPVRGFYNLMNTPAETLLYDKGAAGSEAVLSAFDAAGGMMLGGSVVPKPRNALMTGIGNGRELKGHHTGAQPHELQPSVHPQQLVRPSKMSSTVLEDFLRAHYPDFRVEHSRNISERFGPSLSSYYYVSTPLGSKKIRLSDHNAVSGLDSDIELHLGGDIDVAEEALRTGLNMAVPEEIASRAAQAKDIQKQKQTEAYDARWKSTLESQLSGLQKARNLTPDQRQKSIARQIRRSGLNKETMDELYRKYGINPEGAQ